MTPQNGLPWSRECWAACVVLKASLPSGRAPRSSLQRGKQQLLWEPISGVTRPWGNGMYVLGTTSALLHRDERQPRLPAKSVSVLVSPSTLQAGAARVSGSRQL